MRDIMTPDQAADYLQVSRETIYRYIRQGRLAASRLGRNYRIARRDLDLMLWESRIREDFPVRRFTAEEVAGFLQADQLDEEATRIAQEFLVGDFIAHT